jgi:hypothetical protein
MKAAQSHQKSYTDRRRGPLVFEVGDYVYLKVTPMKKKQLEFEESLTPDLWDLQDLGKERSSSLQFGIT